MSGKLSLEEIIHFLLDAPMFGDLTTSELSQIVHIMQVRHLADGEYVFQEGAPGDAWYLVHAGEVEVFKASADGDARSVAVLGVRTCFGEMAILDGSPRSASVRANGDVTAFCFPRADFNELISRSNIAAYKLVYQMARVLVARQRKTTEQLVQLYDRANTPSVKDRISPIIDRSSVAE